MKNIAHSVTDMTQVVDLCFERRCGAAYWRLMVQFKGE